VLFDYEFMDKFLSKTPWYAIPFAWIPIILYFLFINELSLIITVVLILAGIWTWTLLEYLLHRFLFHGVETWLPDNKAMFLVHFLLHGIHHAFPMDRYRLVFPVMLGYVSLTFLFLPFFDILFCLAPWALPALKAGGIVGYVSYDMIHYFIHHSSPKG